MDWYDDPMDEDDILEKRTKLKRFPSSHLSAPLVYYPQRLILDYFAKGIIPENPVLKGGYLLLQDVEKLNPGCGYTEDASPVYSQIFSRCYDCVTRNFRCMRIELDTILKACILEWEASKASLENYHPGLSSKFKVLNEQQRQAVCEELSGTYEVFKHVKQIRAQIQREHMNLTKCIQDVAYVAGMKVYTRGEVIAVVYDSQCSQCAVLNYEQWLMLVDTVSSRFITQLVVRMNDCTKVDVLPSYCNLIKLYKWGDSLIKSHGMDAYALIGEFESFVTGIFVTFPGSNPLQLGDDFIDSIYESSKEIEAEYHIPVRKTTEILTILRGISSVNELSEIFGLRKHWGNPMVCAQASGRAIQEKVNEDLPIQTCSLLDLLASFNRMIVLSFIERHHQWPKCSFLDTGVPYPLKTTHENRSTKILESHPGHLHIHWARLTFQCNCILDEYENQLSYLSDKSVSLPVSELDSIYFYTENGKKRKRNPAPSHERRLILELIKRDQLSIMEILKIVMKGQIPSEWLANSGSMKGTEMKYMKARIFAVLTFELRQYFAITEDIIKKHIFPYNPHQTMTMSEVELLKTLREITKQMDIQSESRFLNVMHIIDFSKWNLRMKYENTHHVFRSMDLFIGCPGLIERSHIIIESLVNLIQDPYNPPADGVKNTESDTIWRLHDKGWEGQRQKGWTTITSALLADLERRTGVKSIICGQGDNQTLLSSFPVPTQYKNPNEWVQNDKTGVRKILDDFYQELEKLCGEVGLKVKTAESCRSLNYLNYGKRLYFSGVELSMTLKRLSKAMTESNDSFPITEARMKTSEGASFAAGLYSNPSPWPFITSRFCSMIVLLDSYEDNPLIGDYGARDILGTDSMHTKVRFLSTILKIPASLGGPPQQPFSSFFCRGHPDPLCNDLVTLSLKAKRGCTVSRAIIRCARRGLWFKSDKIDKESLIHSPYSLNLVTPISATKPIAKAVLPAMKTLCHNKKVNEILSLTVSNQELELIKGLSSLDPFNPLVANEIYSRSVPGQRQTFIEGLSNSTSMCRMVTETESCRLIDQVIQLEINQLNFWKRMVEDVNNNSNFSAYHHLPHHLLAQSLRDGSWGTRIEGVTVPHPMELFRLTKTYDDDCSNHEKMACDEHIVFVRHSDNLNIPIGSDCRSVQMLRSKTGDPFLGSKINEGLSCRQVLCKNPTESWKDACRLDIVRKWVADPGGNLDALIKLVMSSRTDANHTLIDLATGRPSRLSYTHRASLIGTKKVCSLTTVSNMLSRIYASSNKMGEYSSGDVNYHLPYGPTFLVFESLISLYGVLDKGEGWRNKGMEIYHAHVAEHNIPVVYDGRLSIDRSPDVSLFNVSGGSSQLFFSLSRKLIFEEKTVGIGTGFANHERDASDLDRKVGYAMSLIGDLFVKEIVKRELMDADTVGSFPDREASITAGDIKLTGVIGIVRAISSNVLLSIDIDFIWTHNRATLTHSVSTFLSWFSHSFWKRITTPMIHPKVIGKLISLSRSDSGRYHSNRTNTLKDHLISAVAHDFVSLVTTFQNCFKSVTDAPFSIFVPNFRVGKHMFGKYAEVCVWIYSSVNNVRKKDAVKCGRKIRQAVHSYTGDQFQEMVALARAKFMELLGLVNSNMVINVPRLKIFDFSHPWIDELRELIFNENDPTSSCLINIDAISGESLEYRMITFPVNEIMYDTPICKCNPCEKPFVPRTDFFFLRSGVYSEDHLIMAHGLACLKLSVTNVVLLGDTYGELSLSISGLEKCKKVYCAGTKPITEYDPHLAATIAPSAFVNSVSENKLFMAGSASVIGNPLTDKDSLGRMISQLSTQSWQGCVVRLDLKDTYCDQVNLRPLDLSEMLISVFAGLKDLEWAMLVLTYHCAHEVMLLANTISQVFTRMHLIAPKFLHPELNKTCLVFTDKRTQKKLNPEGKMRMSLANDNSIVGLLHTISRRSYPSLFSCPAVVQHHVALICGTSSNFSSMCHRYIDGWDIQSQNADTAEKVLMEISSVETHNYHLLEVIFKSHASIQSNQTSVRTRVLNLSAFGENKQIKDGIDILFKLRILKKVLSLQSKEIGLALEVVESCFKESRTIKIFGQHFLPSITIVHFMEVYSQALFCIIGHIWGTASTHQLDDYVTGVHYVDKFAIVLKSFTDIPALKLGGVAYRSDLSYAWFKRAKILATLMIQVLEGRRVETINVEEELLKFTKDTMISLRRQDSEEATSGKIQLLWAIGTDISVNDILFQVKTCRIRLPFYATVHCTDLSSWFSKFKIEKLYRIPRTGLIPTCVLTRVSEVCLQLKETVQVDFRKTIDVHYSSRSAFNCHCYDCAVESFVLENSNLEVFDLDRMTRRQLGETVFDLNH